MAKFKYENPEQIGEMSIVGKKIVGEDVVNEFAKGLMALMNRLHKKYKVKARINADLGK